MLGYLFKYVELASIISVDSFNKIHSSTIIISNLVVKDIETE